MSTEFRLETSESMEEFESMPFVCVQFGSGGGQLGFQFESVKSMAAFMTLFTMMPETKLVSERGFRLTGEEMMGLLSEAERLTTTEFAMKKLMKGLGRE